MKRLLSIALLMLCTVSIVLAQGSQVFETRTVKSDILKMDRKYEIYLP